MEVMSKIRYVDVRQSTDRQRSFEDVWASFSVEALAHQPDGVPNL